MFAPSAVDKRIALAVEVSDHPGRVRCDRARLLRVFGNLLGNASKFTPAGGAISVRARPDGEAVRFSVTDSGAGIPAPDVERIFERGFRGGRSGVGLGLGLAIAKSIVEAHGGTIGVESAVDRGSSFWFRIPLA